LAMLRDARGATHATHATPPKPSRAALEKALDAKRQRDARWSGHERVKKRLKETMEEYIRSRNECLEYEPVYRHALRRVIDPEGDE
jgi:hypothetical protein